MTDISRPSSIALVAHAHTQRDQLLQQQLLLISYRDSSICITTLELEKQNVFDYASAAALETTESSARMLDKTNVADMHLALSRPCLCNIIPICLTDYEILNRSALGTHSISPRRTR